MAAAGGAATGAQAQTPSNLRFSNPPGMSSPPGYSHVIEVTGPHRVVYFAGQTGADANGKVGADFRAQAVQVFENIKIALASVGGEFEHIVKMTAYHTNLDANAARPVAEGVTRHASSVINLPDYASNPPYGHGLNFAYSSHLCLFPLFRYIIFNYRLVRRPLW